MKKLLSFLLIGTLVFSLAACGGDDEDNNDSPGNGNNNDDEVFEELYGPAIDVDGQMPILNGNRVVVLELGDIYTEEGIEYDGDYTTEDDIDTTEEGTYKVRYYDGDQLLLVRDVIVTEEIIEISTREELSAIRQRLSGHYVLTSDIDLNRERFTPIGSETNPFTGTFNGNGYTISNLRIDREVESSVNAYQGLFSTIRNGYIGNVTLENVDVKIENLSPSGIDTDTGALVGFLNRSIAENISVSGKVEGDVLVGGVFGFANLSQIHNISANVDVRGSNRVGGITGGLFGSQMHYTLHQGHVEGEKWVAGIVGIMLHQSANRGAVPSNLYQAVHIGSIQGDTDIAGIAGGTYTINMSRTFADTDITINGTTSSSVQGRIVASAERTSRFKLNFAVEGNLFETASGSTRLDQDSNRSDNNTVAREAITDAWYFETLKLSSSHFEVVDGTLRLIQ